MIDRQSLLFELSPLDLEESVHSLIALDGVWAWGGQRGGQRGGQWGGQWGGGDRVCWGQGGGNWNGGRDVGDGGHVSNTWNVRDDVLNQGRAWHQVAVVTGWAWHGDLAEHWRDDWLVNWGSDEAAWLVPVGSCESGLGDVAEGARD